MNELKPENEISPSELSQDIRKSHTALSSFDASGAMDFLLNFIVKVDYKKEEVIKDLDIIDNQINSLFSNFMLGQKPTDVAVGINFEEKLPELLSFGKDLYANYINNNESPQELRRFLHLMERAFILPVQYTSYFESHGLNFDTDKNEFVLNTDAKIKLDAEIENASALTGRSYEDVESELFSSSRNMANLLMTSLLTTNVSPEVRAIHINLARKAESEMQKTNLELSLVVFKLWKTIGIESYDEYLKIMGYVENIGDIAIQTHADSVTQINSAIEFSTDSKMLEQFLAEYSGGLPQQLNDPQSVESELEKIKQLFNLTMPEGIDIEVLLATSNGASPRNMQIGKENGGSTVILNPWVGHNTPLKFTGHEYFGHAYHNALIETLAKIYSDTITPNAQISEWFATGLETAVAKILPAGNVAFNKLAGYVINARINTIGLINYEMWGHFIPDALNKLYSGNSLNNLHEHLNALSKEYFNWDRINASNVFGSGRMIDPFWTTDGLRYLPDSSNQNSSRPLFELMEEKFGSNWLENSKAKEIIISLMADSGSDNFQTIDALSNQISFYLKNEDALQKRLNDLQQLGFKLN